MCNAYPPLRPAVTRFRTTSSILAVALGLAAFLHPGSDAAAQFVELERDAPTKKKESATSRSGTPQGQVYTWDDGGRTRRAYLQEDLIVAADGAVASSGIEVAGTIEVARTSGGPIVRVAEASRADGLPVFRSQSGALMTLPGGVLLVFDAQWTESGTDAFFAANGIGMDRVSPLGEIPNGFVVETEPGFPSLDLARALAGLDGVRLSSPNWWRESSTK